MPPSWSPRRPPAGRSRWPRGRSRLAGRVGRPVLSGLVGMGLGAAALLVWLASPALAQTVDPTLGQVIDRLRTVLVGLLVGLATLFLTVGGCGTCSPGGIPGRSRRPR